MLFIAGIVMLYRVETLQTKVLVEMKATQALMVRMGNLLDKGNSVMQQVSDMESRLAKKDEIRDTQERLRAAREGGWKGV